MSSASALSAGEDSAPEVSEKRSLSNGLRGVVKEGFRKGVADAVPEAKLLDVCVFDLGGGAFDGVAKPKPAGWVQISKSDAA